MAILMTLPEFVERANTVHCHKYDYSNSVYKSTHTKLEVMCTFHGTFLTSPANHLKGSGCRQCGLITRRLTNLTKYGVEHVQQSNDIRNKGKVTCLRKYGVEYSGQSDNNITKRTHTMVTKYGVTHNSKCSSTLLARRSTWMDNYGVDNPQKVESIRQKTKHTWMDKYGVDHPSKHPDIQSKKQRTCLERYGVSHATQADMKNILPLIGSYDWLYDQYITQGKNTTTISTELNIHHSSVWNYLMLHEIHIKRLIGYSYVCIEWLDAIMKTNSINIQHQLNGGEYKIPGTRYKVDGYCQETNTIYEFHGDFWHGNIEVYDPDTINEINGKTMGELYQKTTERENIIKEMGYNMITMWENNWNNLNRKSI